MIMLSVQLDAELCARREEVSLTEHQLQATRELVTVLQKHIDTFEQRHDIQSVSFLR